MNNKNLRSIARFIVFSFFLIIAELAAADNYNEFGYGGGHTFGWAGVKYDYALNQNYFISSNLGAIGANIGVKYRTSYIGSGLAGSVSSYYGYNPYFGHTIDMQKTISIGLGAQKRFKNKWAMTIEAHYLKFPDLSGLGYEDETVRISIGFQK